MKKYCLNCGLEIIYEDRCPRCGADEIGTKGLYVVAPANISEEINRTISNAAAYKVSEYKCFCGCNHNMVWPSIRDSEDYNRLITLTTLPQCPIRVWKYSKVDMPLNEFLKGARYE